MNNKFEPIKKEEYNLGERKIVSRSFARTAEEEEQIRQIIDYSMQNLRKKLFGDEVSLNGKNR